MGTGWPHWRVCTEAGLAAGILCHGADHSNWLLVRRNADVHVLQVDHICARVHLCLVLCLPAHPLHVYQTLVCDVLLGGFHLVPEAGPSD